jgi:tetratricopeptide (TPR) repeat protein
VPGDRILLSWRAETLLKAAEATPAFVRDAVDACCAVATAVAELEEAMDWLAQAMALGPEDPMPLSIAVTRLRAHARLAQARAPIDGVLDRPVGPETNIGNWAIALKGLVLRDLARDADAIALLERVRVAGPDLAWVLITLAEALRASAPGRALEYLARAKSLVPEDLRATILEAQIQGDRDLAAAIRALEEERARHHRSEAVHAALAAS